MLTTLHFLDDPGRSDAWRSIARLGLDGKHCVDWCRSPIARLAAQYNCFLHSLFSKSFEGKHPILQRNLLANERRAHRYYISVRSVTFCIIVSVQSIMFLFQNYSWNGEFTSRPSLLHLFPIHNPNNNPDIDPVHKPNFPISLPLSSQLLPINNFKVLLVIPHPLYCIGVTFTETPNCPVLKIHKLHLNCSWKFSTAASFF